MPSSRYKIGDFWLSQRSGSTKWYATWFDDRTRQTRRTSLGTSDFWEAQVKLAEYVTRHAELKNHAVVETPLATVLLKYWHEHASKIASHEAARYGLALWTEFWGEATIADLTFQHQEQFVSWLKGRN